MSVGAVGSWGWGGALRVRATLQGQMNGADATWGGVHLVSCVSLSAIKSCGEPAPAFTSSPVPLRVTAEPGRHSVFSGPLCWAYQMCVLSVARQRQPSLGCRLRLGCRRG